jgi:hypothetical protein
MEKEQQQMTVPGREELKTLALACGPCITILIRMHRTETRNRQEVVQLKDAIHTVRGELTAKAVDPATIRDLIDPIQDFVDDAESWTRDRGTFVILRSPAVFRAFPLPEELNDAAIVDGHFYLLPLVRGLENRKSFYLLALSRKHVRLLHCTEDHSEEVPLPPGVPKSLDEWLATRPPENPKPEMLGTGEFTSPTDLDEFNAHVLELFHEVNRGITRLLNHKSEPLVLAGVEKELALYRSVNEYPHLVEEGVHGSPDGLKGGELHKRALEVVRPEFTARLEKALADFERLGGTHRTPTDVPTIVRASREGRVAQLIVAETVREPDDHLINEAAVQTIAHSGEVIVAEPDKVPRKSQVAAILRY